METVMTLSRMADLIIVFSFFSLCGAGIGHIIGQAVILIIDKVKGWHGRYRAKKAENQPEE